MDRCSKSYIIYEEKITHKTVILDINNVLCVCVCSKKKDINNVPIAVLAEQSLVCPMSIELQHHPTVIQMV